MSIMLYSVLSTELSIKTLEYKFGEKKSACDRQSKVFKCTLSNSQIQMLLGGRHTLKQGRYLPSRK